MPKSYSHIVNKFLGLENSFWNILTFGFFFTWINITNFLYVFVARFHITLEKFYGYWGDKVFRKINKFISYAKKEGSLLILRIIFFHNLLIIFYHYCYEKLMFLVFFVCLTIFRLLYLWEIFRLRTCGTHIANQKFNSITISALSDITKI